MGFTPEQASALRRLHTIWPEEKLVVIGATAIGCHLEFLWRKTQDLDLTIAADIDECRQSLERLPGWVRHERVEQAWTAPGDVRIDIVPANAAALESGRIYWPSGSTMSAVGLRAAFAANVRLDVGEGIFARVASAAAITILKMAASLDRPDRERDLADLAYLMDGIVGNDDAERWSDPVLDLDYELVSPFLLGRRVAAIADVRERAVVGRFLAKLADPSDRSAYHARMVSSGPREWREGDAAIARLNAFRRGFTS